MLERAIEGRRGWRLGEMLVTPWRGAGQPGFRGSKTTLGSRVALTGTLRRVTSALLSHGQMGSAMKKGQFERQGAALEGSGRKWDLVLEIEIGVGNQATPGLAPRGAPVWKLGPAAWKRAEPEAGGERACPSFPISRWLRGGVAESSNQESRGGGVLKEFPRRGPEPAGLASSRRTRAMEGRRDRRFCGVAASREARARISTQSGAVKEYPTASRKPLFEGKGAGHQSRRS